MHTIKTRRRWCKIIYVNKWGLLDSSIWNSSITSFMIDLFNEHNLFNKIIAVIPFDYKGAVNNWGIQIKQETIKF